jgi:predicted Zn-ribbon and HTH transcriptional regulator
MEVKVRVFKCKRCGHNWASKQVKPGMCPKCKTRLWNKAKKRKVKQNER